MSIIRLNYGRFEPIITIRYVRFISVYVLYYSKMSKVVTARLPERLVKYLDLLVRQGIFDTRSEAIRELLTKQMESIRTVLDFEIVQQLREPQIPEEKLLQLSKTLFDQPTWKLVREGRERRSTTST